MDHRKAREFQKKIYFCFIDYAKGFDCVDHNKLWKILKETGIPDHLTCLMRNLYAGQVATVRTGHGTTDLFQIGKGVRQVCILSPCYLTYMQSTSCKMPGWMKHKLESRSLAVCSVFPRGVSSYTIPVSLLHVNQQVVNFQICECVLSCSVT